MFFWKFTRSGKYSTRYISLILDFHCSKIEDGCLCVSFDECKDILCLMHDVEFHNSQFNYSAGIMKGPFQTPINLLGYTTTTNYRELRSLKGLVLGKMTLGTHNGDPLDYGASRRKDTSKVMLDINKLNIKMNIDSKTGIIYGTEDKLKAYRSEIDFVNDGFYFDLMPKHDCMIEIFQKMYLTNPYETIDFVIKELKWTKL